MEDSLIVSVSGLRGVVGRSLDSTVAATYAVAFAHVLPPGPIVIGRDGRTHGPLLARAITDGRNRRTRRRGCRRHSDFGQP